jgi:hypothetical protein
MDEESFTLSSIERTNRGLEMVAAANEGLELVAAISIADISIATADRSSKLGLMVYQPSRACVL